MSDSHLIDLQEVVVPAPGLVQPGFTDQGVKNALNAFKVAARNTANAMAGMGEIALGRPVWVMLVAKPVGSKTPIRPLVAGALKSGELFKLPDSPHLAMVVTPDTAVLKSLRGRLKKTAGGHHLLMATLEVWPTGLRPYCPWLTSKGLPASDWARERVRVEGPWPEVGHGVLNRRVYQKPGAKLPPVFTAYT